MDHHLHPNHCCFDHRIDSHCACSPDSGVDHHLHPNALVLWGQCTLPEWAGRVTDPRARSKIPPEPCSFTHTGDGPEQSTCICGLTHSSVMRWISTTIHRWRPGKERRQSNSSWVHQEVSTSPQHIPSVGCLTYVLHNDMQAGKILPKWSSRTWVGINLGFSAQHTHMVSLILSLSSGLTSLQFHTWFDDTFSTVCPGNLQPVLLWQEKAGFTAARQGEGATH